MKKKTTKDQKKELASDTYETEIEYTCPVRGKVKQKVMVRRIAPIETNPAEETQTSKSIAEKLDKRYSGLFLSNDKEDIN